MAHPNSKEGIQLFVDNDPFQGFQIDDDSILDELNGRYPCPKCNKSRKFYCYSCYVPIEPLENKLPFIKLPIKIDIIKHRHEIDGKSTSGHAAVLANQDVKVYIYPNIPNYYGEKAILIYPSYNAISIGQLVEQNNYEDILNLKCIDYDLPQGFNRTTLKTKFNKHNNNIKTFIKELQIDKVVFIDSTWNKSKSIFKDPNINQIPCVMIENRLSQFWRHQKGSPRWYLATVEAIHQFLVEIHIYMWGINKNYQGVINCFPDKFIENIEHFYSCDINAYNGQYDNLLFFFKHMYYLIHTFYDHDDLKAYKRKID